MCIAYVNLNDGVIRGAVIGIAPKVSERVELSESSIAICLCAPPESEQMKTALELLDGGMSPEEVISDIIPQAAQQWIVGNVHTGFATWCGENVSKHRFAEVRGNIAAMGNWLSSQTVAEDLFAKVGSPVSVLRDAVTGGALLVRARSGIRFEFEGTAIGKTIVNFGEGDELFSKLAFEDVIEVPENIGQAWELAGKAYGLVCTTPGHDATVEGIELGRKANTLDPGECQTVLWALIGAFAIDEETNELMGLFLAALDENHAVAVEKARTLFGLIDSEATGLGKSASYYARQLAEQL